MLYRKELRSSRIVCFLRQQKYNLPYTREGHKKQSLLRPNVQSKTSPE